jgi:DNA-binding response OmpR family regulator
MINSKELLQYTENLTLLFAEDHDELRENTTEILKNFFKKVDSVENGEKALEYYENEISKGKAYDIVLTDIRMPKMNGVELTEKIYKLKPSQPLIVISAHDESAYLLSLINLGIEQFLKKPIDYQELLKVLLRISKKITSEKIVTNLSTEVQLNEKITFNKESMLLLEDGISISLTKFEIIFLNFLTQNVGTISSNEEIVNHFSQMNESIDPQNIRKLVSKIRKKIPEESLESVYGVGYRIIPIL